MFSQFVRHKSFAGFFRALNSSRASIWAQGSVEYLLFTVSLLQLWKSKVDLLRALTCPKPPDTVPPPRPEQRTPSRPQSHPQSCPPPPPLTPNRNIHVQPVQASSVYTCCLNLCKSLQQCVLTPSYSFLSCPSTFPHLYSLLLYSFTLSLCHSLLSSSAPSLP